LFDNLFCDAKIDHQRLVALAPTSADFTVEKCLLVAVAPGRDAGAVAVAVAPSAFPRTQQLHDSMSSANYRNVGFEVWNL
jgi:hypothetical protein